MREKESERQTDCYVELGETLLPAQEARPMGFQNETPILGMSFTQLLAVAFACCGFCLHSLKFQAVTKEKF